MHSAAVLASIPAVPSLSVPAMLRHALLSSVKLCDAQTCSARPFLRSSVPLHSSLATIGGRSREYASLQPATAITHAAHGSRGNKSIWESNEVGDACHCPACSLKWQLTSVMVLQKG